MIEPETQAKNCAISPAERVFIICNAFEMLGPGVGTRRTGDNIGNFSVLNVLHRPLKGGGIGGGAVGEDENQGPPIAFLGIGGFADLAFHALQQYLQRAAQSGSAAGAQLRLFELQQLCQRDDLPRLAVKGDHGQIGGFQGLRVAFELGEQGLDALPDRLNGFPHHGAGTVQQEIDR